MAVVKAVVVSRRKIEANAALTNLLPVAAKVAEEAMMLPPGVEEDLQMQDPADARERKAVAAAAALKVQLKEEDQKSNFLK